MTMIISGDNGLTFPNSTIQASAGSVLQVVNATYSTQTSNSTSTLADTGLTATITPKFATSKILVLINHNENLKSAANSNNDLAIALLRNGTNIFTVNKGVGYTASASSNQFSTSGSYLDSPASVSALVYKTQFANGDNNGAVVYVQTNGTQATITLMEIAG